MEDFTFEQRTALRKWIVSQVTTIIGNLSDHEASLNEIIDAACLAVIDDVGRPRPTLDDYATAVRNGSTDDYVTAVGAAVSDTIHDWIVNERQALRQKGESDSTADLLIAMLWEILDLEDATQKFMLGGHYLPTPDDLETWVRADADRIDDFDLDVWLGMGASDDDEESD